MRTIITVLFLLNMLSWHAQTVLLNVDFESGIPEGWIIRDEDGLTVDPSVADFQTAWIAATDPVDAENTCAGSTSFFSPEARASRWLISPAISLAEYGNLLYWRAASHDPSYPDGYLILVSQTGTETSDFTDTLFRRVAEFPEWTDRVVNMSDSGYNNQTVHLAFVNNTNKGFKLYLDDIRVEINDPSSLAEHEAIKLLVYPNPAKEELFITTDYSIEDVKLFTSNGMELPVDHFERIDVRGLSNGLYFLQITTSAGIVNRKFVKD
jgi:hypothetical protein